MNTVESEFKEFFSTLRRFRPIFKQFQILTCKFFPHYNFETHFAKYLQFSFIDQLFRKPTVRDFAFKMVHGFLVHEIFYLFNLNKILKIHDRELAFCSCCNYYCCDHFCHCEYLDFFLWLVFHKLVNSYCMPRIWISF